MDNRFAIIMAGGSGTRFWPESRKEKPKQLLDLLGTGKNLLRVTFERTAEIMPRSNIYIVTGEKISGAVKRAVPELDDENILKEPIGRNTAPCIGWASQRIAARNAEALIAVFPSDHYIQNGKEFIRVIEAAFRRIEERDSIVTLGIMPSRPATGYGYIESGKEVSQEVKSVLRFVEKPDRKTAEKYLEQGNFYWNGGIFVFRAMRIIKELKEKLPDIHSVLQTMQEAFTKEGLDGETTVARNVFPSIDGISIDYGVMEKATDVEVIPSDFGWSDLGSWRAIYEKIQKDKNGNTVRGGGTLLVHEAKNCLVSAPSDKVAAVVGLENVIIVDTQDALLVCSMDKDQNVRDIVSQLKKSKDTRV